MHPTIETYIAPLSPQTVLCGLNNVYAFHSGVSLQWNGGESMLKIIENLWSVVTYLTFWINLVWQDSLSSVGLW